MTPAERRAEFRRLFMSIPGSNADRIKRVADALQCKPNTVRIYLLRTDNAKTPPEGKLVILGRELARDSLAAR